MSRRNQPAKRERGFAMLLVFVMAAAVALMLYRQMPRAAFESERDKEQLLIDRGGQYQRAIQVYFATFKRYPSRIEDLENTNDHRFLRKRYLDPYTGKSEWRLIHTNGVALTDSKVQPLANPANGNGTGNGSGTGNNGAGNGAASGAANNNGAGSSSIQTTTYTMGANGMPTAVPTVNATVAARPSDRTLPDNYSYNSAPASTITQAAPYNPPNYNDPVQFPPISLYPNGYNATTQPGQPGQPGNGVQTNPNQPGFNQPGLNQPGFNPNQPGLNQPGLNQPGLNQPGLNQSGFNPSQFGGNPPTLPAGMTPPGLPPSLPPGLQPPGLNQSGLNQSGLNPNQPGVGQPGLGQPAPGTVPGFPGGVATSPDGSQQYPPIQFQPSLPQQQPVQQAPVQPTPVQQAPAQQAPFQQMPGQPQPGQGPFNPSSPGAPGAANPGLNIINQLLTTPRPAPSGIGPATNNQTIGGGIAGVASTFTGATIKSYGGRTDYSEWEFVYQLPQQAGMPQNVPQQNGQPQSGQPYLGTGTNVPGPPPTGVPPPPSGGFPSVPSLPH